MSRAILKGSTDQSTVIRIVDSTDQTPETGVVWNTAGIDLWYRREGGLKVSITEATLAALDTAHADGGFLHIGDGYYRLDLPDAAVATGADGVVVGGTVTGMVVIAAYHALVAALPPTTGTSDSGTTTTMVDAARTEAETDYWKGSWIRFTSGTLSGQTRLITGFTPGTDTITFDPATTLAAGTHTYEILPAAGMTAVVTTPPTAAAIATAVLTTVMTEAYAADGATMTLSQFSYMVWCAIQEFSISSLTITGKKIDGSTTAMTWTMDHATSPTSRTRAT